MTNSNLSGLGWAGLIVVLACCVSSPTQTNEIALSPRTVKTAGALHLPTVAALLRYSTPANTLGLPALAVPVGAAEGGGARLPVSLQLMARPWHEASLLRAGCLLEAALRERGAGAPLPQLLVSNPVAAAAGGTNP